MNLQDMLNRGRIDCFKMADQSYFQNSKVYYNFQQYYSRYKDNPSLTDNFHGAQLALIAEYYLKGILLPVLEITIPDDDDEIKQIASQLTDKQKYQIISSDSRVILELQQLYSGMGISGKKIVSKLGKEALQSYGHDLNALITKIVEKAEQGKFRDAYMKKRLENQETDEGIRSYVSDSYIKDRFSQLLDYTRDTTVRKAFPEGRYGHLNDYVADTEILTELVDKIRKYVIDISAGIELVLDESDSILPLDKCIEFPDKLRHIAVFDNTQNISRVFEWKNNKLILKYGIEEHDKRDIDHNTFMCFEGHRIFIKPGEKIKFFYDNEERKTYDTRHGKIEKAAVDYKGVVLSKKEPQYFSQILQKSADNVERKLTDEVVTGGQMKSKLGIKYMKYYNSSLRLSEIRGVTYRYNLPRQKNSILHRKRRPSSDDFRKAYVEYLGDKVSYRMEKGRQIFLEMMSYVKKGELKSEALTILKDTFKSTRSENSEER
jgi:hypothetical protein